MTTHPFTRDKGEGPMAEETTESDLPYESLVHLKQRYDSLRTELRERRNAAVDGSEEFGEFNRLYTEVLHPVGVRYEEVHQDYLDKKYSGIAASVTAMNQELDRYKGLFDRAKALYEEPGSVTMIPNPPRPAAPAPTEVRRQHTQRRDEQPRRRRGSDDRRDPRKVTDQLRNTSN